MNTPKDTLTDTHNPINNNTTHNSNNNTLLVPLKYPTGIISMGTIILTPSHSNNKLTQVIPLVILMGTTPSPMGIMIIAMGYTSKVPKLVPPVHLPILMTLERVASMSQKDLYEGVSYPSYPGLKGLSLPLL